MSGTGDDRLGDAYLALFESEQRDLPAVAGHLVWCRGCGAFWTEPPDPRPLGPDPDDDSCACTCTDDTDPHYEDWYPVVLPYRRERSDA